MGSRLLGIEAQCGGDAVIALRQKNSAIVEAHDLERKPQADTSSVLLDRIEENEDFQSISL